MKFPVPVWKSVLEPGCNREITSGNEKTLCDAVGRAAGLRIHTEFRHNEHIDPSSGDTDIIREVSEFRETCLLEKRWTAGFMTLRQPVSLPDRFGWLILRTDGACVERICNPYSLQFTDANRRFGIRWFIR